MRTFKDQYGPSRFVDAFLGWTLDPFDYWLMAYVLVAIAAEFKSPEPAQATSFSHRLRAVWSRARRFLLSPAPSMPRHALFVLLAGVAFAGGRLPARQTPPVLDQIQPIRLAPARNVTLERPVGLALDQDGGFYVVDGKGGNVLRYSGSGAPVTRYGAPGDAPGQLRSPGEAQVVDDTLLVVVDGGRGDLNIFDRRTGRFIKRLVLRGMPGSVRGAHGALWIGLLNIDARTSIARVTIGDARVEPSVALPRSYVKGGPIAGIRYNVHVVPEADTLFVGFEGTDYILAVRRNRTSDTIFIPVRARHGAPADIGDRLAHAAAPSDAYTKVSSLRTLETMAPGRLLAAHMDLSMHPGATFPRTPGGPPSFSYRLYVSVLDLKAKRACVDLTVPISTDQVSSLAVRGDTVFVVDQDTTAAQRPWLIRRFVVRDRGCAWQPMRVAAG